MSWKPHFSRFFAADPDRLHAAAHSHHPWPDVTFAAHQQAWLDAAALADDKWDHVFSAVFESARRRLAAVLGLPDPGTLVFAPSVHELVVRIVSTLPRRSRVLTTNAEFHSFARQLRRWEEAGMAQADRVPAEPYPDLSERLVAAYNQHDLVLFSHVHFDSGYVVPDLAALASSFGEGPVIAIDAYHGFMAVPTDLASVAGRAYYLAGGYKYAMAGEGAGFAHVPGGADHRPVNTGWWAGFGSMAERQDGVAYGPGGWAYAGATFDPTGVYRLNAVLGWAEELGLTVETIHDHVCRLQHRLIELLPEVLVESLVPGVEAPDRGNFLTFRRPDADDLYRRAPRSPGHHRPAGRPLAGRPGHLPRRGRRRPPGGGDQLPGVGGQARKALYPWPMDSSTLDIVYRLLVGAGLAAIIGLEREATGKSAGLRTHALVGLGASLFAVVSEFGFEGGDPSRVASQIVSGVGFLGAGAIFRSGPLITGLTTAAGLWAAAAIGTTAGAGDLGVATAATGVGLVVLLGLRFVDTLVDKLRQGVAVEAKVEPASAYVAVREGMQEIDPTLDLADFRLVDGGGVLRFIAPPDRAEMTVALLSALDEVTECRLVEDG